MVVFAGAGAEAFAFPLPLGSREGKPNSISAALAGNGVACLERPADLEAEPGWSCSLPLPLPSSPVL